MIPFTLNVKTLATANLAFQILLIFTASVASYFAINKDFKRHCALIRIAVLFQIIIVAAFMLPSMTGYLKIGILSNPEMLIHHTLGLLVIILWIYINLVMGKMIRRPKKFIISMKLAFLLWFLAFLLGLHMYLRIYT